MEYTWITIFAFAFLFFTTAAGAACVWLFKNKISDSVNALIFGFASGVMLAALIWSLVIPAVHQASVFSVAAGLLLGGAFLIALDKATENKQGALLGGKKFSRLFWAMTLHNIPEGLAVGFAFGAAYALQTAAAYTAALGVALGIGIQNVPEGAALALPAKEELKSRKKAFLFSTASGVVEPIFAVVGFFLAAWLRALQPWFLSFAAGAMLFVVATDLIPDSKSEARPFLGGAGVIVGFALMMILDIALG